MIKQAKDSKPVSPQMTVAELCATIGTTPPVVNKLADAGAPVNPAGKTDLFGLFEWLFVHQDHPHLAAADEVLVAQWKIFRNV
ncbi:hypothetical protein [Burkholderia sp. BE17]|uniref:hypothetical protein n=1 Tax=Burkholderia sp. BE17 TaxID=2656644 RepID=UPI00128B5AD9|nr:hypothetical protein [Burkholderia sp. BE17]MPV66322.1 hypothetical protein [Burkholderia sp. BE17]